MNNTSEAVLSPVTFHIFRRDGSRNPDIKHSFLEIMDVSAHDIAECFIRLEDGTIWSLVCEADVKTAFKSAMLVKCIISFQARVNGNFAVARLHRTDYKPKGRHS